jgi:hypothetical protein
MWDIVLFWLTGLIVVISITAIFKTDPEATVLICVIGALIALIYHRYGRKGSGD